MKEGRYFIDETVPPSCCQKHTHKNTKTSTRPEGREEEPWRSVWNLLIERK
jgi:hypothetical protein